MQNKRYIVRDGKPLLVRLLTLSEFSIKHLGCGLDETKRLICGGLQLPSNPLGLVTTKLLSARSKV